MIIKFIILVLIILGFVLCLFTRFKRTGYATMFLPVYIYFVMFFAIFIYSAFLLDNFYTSYVENLANLEISHENGCEVYTTMPSVKDEKIVYEEKFYDCREYGFYKLHESEYVKFLNEIKDGKF